MDIQLVLVNASVAIVVSAITAYVTTRLRMREEREKWRREFAMRFAEVQATDGERAQRIATQFAVGVLKFRTGESGEHQKLFVSSHCRLVAGRGERNEILLNDLEASRQHCVFDADDKNVYVEDLGPANATFVNGERITGRRKLKTGDIILVGATEFSFKKLDDR